jgi:hypothetical protein
MKTIQTLVGFLIGFVALAGRPARGCVFVETTLWEKIQTAELIAFVRVAKLERGPDHLAGAALVGSEGDTGGFDPDVAVLKIVETWKGPYLAEVRLNYSGNLYAGSRRVAVGDEVLVFLESGEAQVRRMHEAEQSADDAAAAGSKAGDEATPPEDSLAARDYLRQWQNFLRQWEESRTGRWYLPDYGSGILDARRADMNPLRDLVDEAVRLQAGGPVPEEAQRAWFVKAAELRATRASAVEHLHVLAQHQESDESDESDATKSRLSEEELQTIADGFVRDPSMDWSVPALLDLLSGYEDDAFDRAVISVIEAGVEAPQIPAWVPEAIRRLIARSGWRDWDTAVWEQHRADGTLREIWPTVAKELGLPSVPPAVLRIDGAEGERVSD